MAKKKEKLLEEIVSTFTIEQVLQTIEDRVDDAVHDVLSKVDFEELITKAYQEKLDSKVIHESIIDKAERFLWDLEDEDDMWEDRLHSFKERVLQSLITDKFIDTAIEQALKGKVMQSIIKKAIDELIRDGEFQYEISEMFSRSLKKKVLSIEDKEEK